MTGWQDELVNSEAANRGVELRVTTAGDGFLLEAEVDHHVLRIVREACLNAMRHGGAKVVEVRYVYTGDELEITVRDEGRGFDPEAEIPRGHFGITGMRERARRIGGEFVIDGKVGSGCLVTLKLKQENF